MALPLPPITQHDASYHEHLLDDVIEFVVSVTVRKDELELHVTRLHPYKAGGSLF